MSPPRFEGGRVPTETHYCSRPNAAQNTAELAIKKLSDQHGCEGSTNSNLRGQQPVSPARHTHAGHNTGTLVLLPASRNVPKTRFCPRICQVLLSFLRRHCLTFLGAFAMR
jgi:hypothetical protein